jgi:hypothetical protein
MNKNKVTGKNKDKIISKNKVKRLNHLREKG